MPAATAPRPAAFVPSPPPPPPAASEPAGPGTPREPDPPSLAAGLDPAERPAFEAVQRAFEVRLRPVDAGERLLVAAIAACHFRRARLDAIEARLTGALLDGRPAEGLPSLPALARVRSALAKEEAALHRDLARLYELRPAPIRRAGLDPARLRWLAARIEEGRLSPWSPPDPEDAPAAPPPAPAAAAHGAPELTAEEPTFARPAQRPALAGGSSTGPGQHGSRPAAPCSTAKRSGTERARPGSSAPGSSDVARLTAAAATNGAPAAMVTAGVTAGSTRHAAPEPAATAPFGRPRASPPAAGTAPVAAQPGSRPASCSSIA